jgi:hypothetical protein
MLGKCTNPSCSASFRYLEDGLLFRLETDPALRLSHPKTSEYYWLCRSCAATMTLRISKDGKVIPVALAAPAHSGHHGRPFISPKRQNGLLLSSITFSKERYRSKGSIGG